MGKPAFEFYGRDCLVYQFSPETLQDKWYRIKERETVRTKTEIKIGDTIKFSRVIARAGYFTEPADMPEELMKMRARQYALSDLRDVGIELQEKQLHDLQGVFGDIWHNINYEVRGRWSRERAMVTEDGKLRTFYYIDLESEHTGIVTARKMKWIGRQYDAHHSGGSYWDPPDYEPGGLADAVRQMVLQVECTFSGHKYIIHPLDAL